MRIYVEFAYRDNRFIRELNPYTDMKKAEEAIAQWHKQGFRARIVSPKKSKDLADK